MPLFDNPLHKGKGSSSAGNSGDDNHQNNDNNPPVLGYYYGDDDELYLYANSPYFDPVDNNDDNTDLLGFYPIINDEQPNAYPISFPVVSNPNYGDNQADEHYWWSYFVPGYGDYLSFKEAETGWDYTLATAGIVWKPARGAKVVSKVNKAKKAAEKAATGKPITLNNGYYSADGMKISQRYYEKLWSNGRPAPFIQAREVLNSNPKITPDRMTGFNKYEGAGLEMVYNPKTGEIWHIQPMK